jgi:hypothetical protein
MHFTERATSGSFGDEKPRVRDKRMAGLPKKITDKSSPVFGSVEAGIFL